MSKLGIIGGSGINEFSFVKEFKINEIVTEYGPVLVKEGMISGTSVVFLNRHGPKCSPPHEINYRGNIQALKQNGVGKIIATAAVGSMNKKMEPGDFVLLSDFIDFTCGRIEYFDPSKFTDISFPYDEGLKKVIMKAAKSLRIKTHTSAVYACTEGPRFETGAEIKMCRKLGADVVGMTQVPEVILAAEAGIPYAVIGVVTNYAAGINKNRISSDEVIKMMKKKAGSLSRLMLQTIS